MKTVIELAREAGVISTKIDGIERFAELVRADERAKLAEQPAPVQGWKLVPVKPTKEMVDALADTDPEHDSVWDAVLSAAPQAPAAQQEPVAWIWKYANGEEEVVFVPPRHICATHVDAPSTITPLYTTPQAQPKREWVGLTDDVLLELLTGVDEQAVRLPPGLRAFARAIEAKLKEKNHG